MAKRVQHPRGDTIAEDAIVGLEGQIRVDLTRKEIRLHDGVTPGGKRLINLEQMLQTFIARNEGLGEEVGFPESGTGFLSRINDTTYEVRLLAAATGITVTNSDGVSGNPSIGVDTTWLNGFIDALVASSGELHNPDTNKLVRIGTAFTANNSVAISFANPIPLDFDTGWNFHCSMTGNADLGNPANIKKQSGIIECFANGGSRDIGLAANWEDTTGLFPITIPSGKRLYISYTINSAGTPIVLGTTTGDS